MTNTMNEKIKGGFKKASLVIILIVAVMIVVSGFTTVRTGQVGVKYRLGKVVDTSLDAGLHYRLPFIERISKVDITEQVYETDATAYTKDTQTVEDIRIKVNYRYDTSKLSDIIRNIGIKNVENKLLIPQLQSTLKNHVGKYKAEELIAFRSELQEDVEEDLRRALAENGIIVMAVNVEDIDFEDSFEDTIRAKVAAEQEALKVQNETVAKAEEARQKVIAAEAEAKAILLKAEAEAEANRLLSESITQQLIDYKKVESWDGQFPQVMGNSVNPFVTVQ